MLRLFAFERAKKFCVLIIFTLFCKVSKFMDITNEGGSELF